MERLRSPFPYPGGKGRIAGWIASLLPRRRAYIEPFCGAANVLFALSPAPVEVINDIDERVVNVFRVLQNRATAEELRHRIMYTPYSRSESARAISVRDSPDASDVDRAWGFMVSQCQAIGGNFAKTRGNWGFAASSGGVTGKWIMRMTMIDAWCHRLRNVQIECSPAVDVIRRYDREDAVIYCDPPYVLSTRVSRNMYQSEMADDKHEELIDVLLSARAAVAISGYDSPIYRRLEAHGWRVERRSVACAITKASLGTRRPRREEVLWIRG